MQSPLHSSLGLQSALFASVACLPVLVHCIHLCYRAQTEPIKFGPELAVVAVMLAAGLCMVSFFLVAGIAWVVFGRRRIWIRATWATLILGVGYGFLLVGVEWDAFPPIALVIGLLVMVPILFTRSEQGGTLGNPPAPRLAPGE